MFEYVKGGLAPASASGYSPLSQRLTQFLTLVLVLGPLIATGFAIARLLGGHVTWLDMVLLGSLYFATSLGVTIGFHRMLTHNSFQAHPLVRAFFLILGTLSIQGAAISWAAIHQKHHVKSDTSEDPHSPTRSFFHAHVGWLFGFERADLNVYAKAQINDPVTMFISRTAFFWVVLGLVIPFLIGGFSGLLWGGLVRVFLAHHVTWSVNSVCHVFGSRPYRIGRDRSTNNWIVGLLALGEGWHNNHHAFPRSAFHGLTRRQIDVSGYIIRFMGLVGLARNIYKVPRELIETRRGRSLEQEVAEA